MRSYDCPSCGAPVSFASSVAVSAVCGYCRSLVVRKDLNVEALGKVAELPPDLSPIQIGATGQWNGSGFTVRGRFRVRWKLGSWTEWYIEFAGGRAGWLGEAQGFFTVTTETQIGKEKVDRGMLKPGALLTLDQRQWRVVDLKQAEYIAAEGELPYVFEPGTARLSVDLESLNGEFGTLEHADGEWTFFSGRSCVFEGLQFQNLRPVPGWTEGCKPGVIRNASRSFSCPNCGATVEIRAAGLTMSAACGSCGAVVDTADGRFQLIEIAASRIKASAARIPIGARGQLLGVEYELIGLMWRHDGYAPWAEYLLFNPWHGFVWLVSYRDHWSFVRRVLNPLHSGEATDIYLGDDHFRLFAKYKAKVTGVLGEFYWKTSIGEEAEVRDWIAPPRILSRETYEGLAEETWSSGEYLDHLEVAKAFGTNLQEPIGVVSNQPNPYEPRWKGVRWILFVVLFGLLGEQFFTGGLSAGRLVETRSARFTRGPAATPPQQIIPLKLDGGSEPVTVEFTTDLSNSWMSFDVDLVNAATNTTYSGGTEVEYYFGSDSDGPWTEGSRNGSAKIGGVPAGTYNLVIEAEADPALASADYTVRVRRGGVFWSNFWICLVAVSIYPVFVFFRRRAFEVQRWSESDYTPYSSSSDD